MSARRTWSLVLVYLLLLAASHVTWWLRRGPMPPAEGELATHVPVVAGGEPTEAVTRLVYRDLGPRSAPVIVLLHGSPGDKENFDDLARELARAHRVLVPDLPGFGASDADLPEISIRSHGLQVGAWLEELEVERAHLVGFSLGGGAALHLIERDPERVASLALVASIGVQELELFGNYELNHALHGLQLGAWHVARWLLPHFGALDSARGYVRSFFESDQRPLRAMLERLDLPLLVVHGAHDFLVSPDAAREHHRLVPHSELLMVEDQGHFLLWLWTEPLASALSEFVAAVEAGRAPTRADAAPARVAQAETPFDPAQVPPFGGTTLLLAMVLLALATLVSEDLTCFSAGLLVTQGRIDFAAAAAACFLGIFVGDVALYLAGRWMGRPALERAPLRWVVSEAGVERARAWFQRRGVAVIFLSRFTPGLRLPTYVAAGVVGTPLGVFALWFSLAGLIWTPALVGLAAWAGREAQDSLDLFGRYALPGALLLILALVLLQRLLVPLLTWRGRRRMWGRLQRIWRWEFWPPLLFYPPVTLWIAWLGVRHRGLGRVTAVNPAIPTGGFIGESKAQILAGLGSDDPRVARWILLRADQSQAQRRESAQSFLLEHQLDYPVVLKPDVGQRGSGVRILRDESQLTAALDEMGVDCLLQEFVPGPEFGVFYLRRPGRARGEIFSVTEKILPAVEGDGRRTLEELILADPRAVCIADAYLKANAPLLYSVPAQGERITLVQLGTHVRGAIFLDGRRVATEALLDAIEDLSRGFAGFSFGRYDLRCTDEAALARGEGFKVLELNGLTSEATSLYDPRHSLLAAYGILFRQWSAAFEIADANIAAGARPTTVAAVVREWLRYRKARRRHEAQSAS